MGLFTNKRGVVFASALWAQAATLFAFEPNPALSDKSAYSLAANAMSDGLYQVAARNFSSLLNAGQLSDSLRSHLVVALVEAQVRAGDGASALEILEENGGLMGEALPFWRGQAQAAAGEIEEAIATLAQVADDSPLRIDAVLTRSSLLQAIGKEAQALEELQAIAENSPAALGSRGSLRLSELQLTMGDREAAAVTLGGLGELSPEDGAARDYLLARIEMGRGDHAAALSRLEPIAAGRNGVGKRLNHGIRLALADAYIGAGQAGKAVALLDTLVSDPGGSPLIGIAFQRMSAAGMLDGEGVADRLAAWAMEDIPERAAYASYHLAKRRLASGQREEAIEDLEKFSTEHPGHRLVELVLIELAELQAAKGRPDAALEALARLGDKPASDADLRSRQKFVEGLALHAEGQTEAAAKAFQEASSLASTEETKVIAAMNAGLANLGRESEDYPLLMDGQVSPERRLIAGSEFALERGIFEASLGHPKARALLLSFLEENPKHSRAAEAELVLAELALTENPPNLDEARKNIGLARDRGLSPQEEERADYISVWVAASLAKPGSLVSASNAFLETWPDSEFRDDVRMRLAEDFYQNQDYPNAQTQFELIAAENPDSVHADAALFFAGRAAMSLLSSDGIDRAITIWGTLINEDVSITRDEENPAPHSAFSLYARYYQAVAKRRLGKHDEALSALEGILALVPAPPKDLALETRIAMGEVYMLLGATDPANYEKAAELFEEIAQGDDRAARYRAGYLSGMCYEQMGEEEKALTASYAPVGDGSGEVDDPATLLWFYRSGFHAISLLSKQEEWEAAVKVAERMARTPGERSEEARLLAERLRLEHFIWEDE